MRTVLAGLVLVLLVAPAHAADEPGVAFRVTDPRITESSGLADTGRAMFTVNDSGHDPVLFRLDPDTGDTAGTLRFAPAAEDVEALAPGGPGLLWVGDIGDNTRSRPHVDVVRVDLRSGATQRLRLRYPDGAHDAETLLVARDATVYLVTKELGPGGVYAAPAGATTLRRVATVGAFLTDGALMPDQRHVLLRDYGQLHVHTFPGFDRVGTVQLPRQPQGEAISVSPAGRIRVSSEGTGEPVHDVVLPPRLVAQMESRSSTTPRTTPTATAAPSPSASASRGPRTTSQAQDQRGSDTAWVWAGLGAVTLAGLGFLLVGLRRARRRSRRSG